jgi:hypothetical protein
VRLLKRIEYFALITGLFKFKTITDEQGNEIVLFAQSNYDFVENIKDRTEFEAYENHVHLIDNIRKNEFNKLVPIARDLGQTLLNCLKFQYPNKQFIVFVSLHLNDSMIIRFHQKWENEEPYCNPSEFTSSKELVFSFES